MPNPIFLLSLFFLLSNSICAQELRIKIIDSHGDVIPNATLESEGEIEYSDLFGIAKFKKPCDQIQFHCLGYEDASIQVQSFDTLITYTAHTSANFLNEVEVTAREGDLRKELKQIVEFSWEEYKSTYDIPVIGSYMDQVEIDGELFTRLFDTCMIKRLQGEVKHFTPLLLSYKSSQFYAYKTKYYLEMHLDTLKKYEFFNLYDNIRKTFPLNSLTQMIKDKSVQIQKEVISDSNCIYTLTGNSEKSKIFMRIQCEGGLIKESHFEIRWDYDNEFSRRRIKNYSSYHGFNKTVWQFDSTNDLYRVKQMKHQSNAIVQIEGNPNTKTLNAKVDFIRRPLHIDVSRMRQINLMEHYNTTLVDSRRL